MVTEGVCEPSSSPWASPLHMVKKKTGGWRSCGDFRQFNKVIVPDRYPIPHIHDFTQQLKGCIIFTTLDLDRAYFQIPVAKEDRSKTAIITLFGLFQFKSMPYGLCNAAQSFQAFNGRCTSRTQLQFRIFRRYFSRVENRERTPTYSLHEVMGIRITHQFGKMSIRKTTSAIFRPYHQQRRNTAYRRTGYSDKKLSTIRYNQELSMFSWRTEFLPPFYTRCKNYKRH